MRLMLALLFSHNQPGGDCVLAIIIKRISREVKRTPHRIRLIYRWCSEPLFRTDINYRRWGVKTTDIKGSKCGLCGKYVSGDPGDPEYPPNWRWTSCQQCLSCGTKGKAGDILAKSAGKYCS
jgi:hypothetical protein